MKKEIKLTKKFRILALKHALSSKLKDGNIVILSEAKLSKPKTSLLVKNLQKMAVDSALFIDAQEFDKNFELDVTWSESKGKGFSDLSAGQKHTLAIAFSYSIAKTEESDENRSIENLDQNTSLAVSYTNLTLPTNREV